MQIALFIYGLTGGGATRRVVTLAEGWAQEGHDVRLIVVDPSGPLKERILKGPLKLVPLSFGVWTPWVRKLSRRQRTFWARWPLARYLREDPPDVFLSAANHAHLSALAARRKGAPQVPLVLRLSNHVRASLLRKKGLKGLKGRFRLASVKKRYPEADFIVGVSQGILDDLLSLIPYPRERTRVIYNPIDVFEIQKRAQEPVDHPWLKEKSCPVILGAGRLSPQKDFATLIKAVARLRKRRPVRLIILGEGKQRRRLEALAVELGIKEAVDLPGFSPNPWAYMARADLFVLSSRWEGLPGVLLEALACGCPVVSTDCPSGPREILDHGRLGPLVPVGDVAALARAMEQVLENPPAPAVLTKRAQDFDVSQAVKAYLEVFEQVVRADVG